MNFYSDIIEKSIIDDSPLDTLMEKLEKFKGDTRDILIKHSNGSILGEYIEHFLKDEIIVAFHCLDVDFDIKNCPSILVYKKLRVGIEIHYYILYACTHFRFRGQGYASRLLDGFLERVRGPRKTKIILSSLESSVVFYETYGFKWLGNCIQKYPILLQYERFEKEKEYFIMEMNVS
jgi:GNAT superfamily N-acetyltransferase